MKIGLTHALDNDNTDALRQTDIVITLRADGLPENFGLAKVHACHDAFAVLAKGILIATGGTEALLAKSILSQGCNSCIAITPKKPKKSGAVAAAIERLESIGRPVFIVVVNKALGVKMIDTDRGISLIEPDKIVTRKIPYVQVGTGRGVKGPRRPAPNVNGLKRS